MKIIDKIIFAMTLLAITFYGSSCSDTDSEKKAQALSSEVLKTLSEDPSNLKIIAYSKLDSVYGDNFIKDKEKVILSTRMLDYQDMMLKNMDTDYGMEEYAKAMAISSTIGPMLTSKPESKDDVFSAYRIKVEFEQIGVGDTYHAERWFILDKSLTHVLHSFEIPIFD